MDISCFGVNDGSITITVSGGFSPNTWLWTSTNPSFSDPGGNTTSLTNLEPGTYTLTVTDANGCLKDTSFTILEPDDIFANGIVTNLSCNNNSSGEINITPIGGSGTYLFDWDNDGTGDNDDLEDLIGLSQGSFCVGIIDQNQPTCRLDTCFIITQPDSIFINLLSITDISCADSLNGAIDIAPSGGSIAVNYQFDWDNDGTGDNDDSEDLSLIGGGTYCISVSDDNGCTKDSCITLDAIDNISFNPIVDSSSCSLPNGNINLTVTGGNSPLSFDWDNDGLGDNDDNEDLLNIPSGTYQLIVSYSGNDGSLCNVDTTFSFIDNPPSPTASYVVVDESCFGACDGSITTTILSGASPMSYVWSSTNPGFTNNGAQSQFNLCSGDYYLSLTDANGCTIQDTFAITSFNQLTVLESITNIDCNGDSTGAISIDVSGGNISSSGNYSYTWSGISTGFNSASEDISNLISDQYQLIVTDDDGCTDSLVYDVTENSLLILTPSSVDVTCGDSNGVVSVIVSGGVVASDYNYSWTDNGSIPIGSTSSVTNLSAGTYTVIVTDDLGCLDSTTATINDLSASTITIDTIIHESCTGDNNGLITVTIAVSPPPGNLSWTGPTGFVDPGGNNTTINNLSAGQYIATLVDGLGCQTQEVIDIIEAQALSLNSSVIEPTCFNFNDGSISIFPSGGSTTAGYQFDWDIDGTGDLNDAQNQDSLTFGTYIVSVFDDNGCTISDTFNLTNPDELIGAVSSSFAACGLNDGYVTSLISGGTLTSGSYTYAWIDQATGLQVGNTDSVAQLPAGCYELTVNDDNNCIYSDITCISNPSGPTITLDQIDSVSCFGGQDGSVFISVSGGNGSYTYDWQTIFGLQPSNNEDLVTWLADSYSITVTDSLGCIAGGVYTIPQPDPIIISGTPTNLTCFNDNSGEINLTISGGTPNYNYNWTGPNGYASNLEDISSLDTGTYIVSGTDANGCNIPTTSFTIDQPDSIALTLSSSPTACDENTGSASVSSSGGTVGNDYSYFWINSSGDTIGNSASIDSLASGIYYSLVTDDNGCSATDSVVISPFGGPSISLDTIIDVPCAGNEDGSIFISVTGNAIPFSYNWSGTVSPDPLHQFNEDLDTWFAGVYSIVVTDTNGCQDSLIGLTIDQPLQLNSTITSSDVLCNGDSTGAINLTVSGGINPHTIEWSSNGILISNQEDPFGLPAGIYDLLVTDSNGCIVADQAIINENPDLSLIGSSVNSSCGNADGQVSVSVSGGTVALDYSYSWFDIASGYPGSPTGSGNATEIGLLAGAYQVIVTDDNGCTDSLIVTLSDDTGPILTYTSTNIACFGSANGSINLEVSGSPSFTYNWIGPPPFVNPGTEDISGLEPGTYTVIVTDANGCVSTESIDVTGPVGPITLNSTISDLTCFSNASGEITIDIIGGTPNYTTNWSGPNGFTSSNEDLTGLDSGQYVLDIIDANGCTLSGQLFDVSQPDSIVIDTTIIQPTCGLSDGEIVVTVSGGTIATDYSYNWDDLSTPSSNIGFSSTLAGISAGNYQITVADDNGCTDSSIISISDLTGPILSATTTDVDCVGDDDGTINLTIVGSGSYLIDWDNDGVGDNDDTEDLILLAAGTYNVTVEDLGTGCVASLSVDINVANSISLSFVSTDISCNNDSTGSINATVNGGTPSFSYNWTLNGFSVSSVEDPFNLSAGNYLLTVTDANGCDYTDSIELTEPDQLTLNGSSINSTCGNSNGEVSVVVTGGTIAADYSYAWFDINSGYPGTPIGSGNATENGLASGSYHVIVTDDNGCLDSLAVAVSDANGPTISYSTVDVLCFGDLTGEINLTVSGNGLFTYSWTGPPSFTDPGTEDLTNLEAGTYSVTVTDINGCIATENITINSPALGLSVNSSISNLSCYNDSTGSIDILISGGTPNYTTSWIGPNGFTSNLEDLVNLDTGEYTVTIVDLNGCQLNGSSFTVNQPDSIAILPTIILPTCNASDGQISVAVSGGTVFSDYTYLWDDISTPAFGISTFSSVTNIGAGNYQVTVTDDNGCVNDTILAINNANAPTLSDSTVHVDCNGNSTGEIFLTISGTSSFTIDWDNDGVGDNDDLADLSGLQAGTYSVIVNDLSTGCVAALSVDVLEPGALTISGLSQNLTCYQDSSGGINISVNGGTSPFNFDWDNDGIGDNDDTEDLSNLTIGTYQVFVTDTNGCSTDSIFSITEPSEISLTALLSNNNCFNDTTGSINITVSGGIPNYNYLWTNSSGLNVGSSEDLSSLIADTYSIAITDDSGCTKDSVFTITSPGEIFLNITTSNANCAFSDGSATANVTGGVLTGPDYTYDWDNDGLGDNDDANSISLLPSGNYTLFVTDDNGCQADSTVSISITTGPSITIDSTFNPLCHGGSDGAIYTSVSGGTSPYNFIWNSGVNQQSEDITNLESGTYFLHIIDAIGCENFDTITLSQPNSITTSFSTTDASCNLCDGSATVLASGGTSSSGYTYMWGDGNTTASTTNLCSGVYSLTVTDENNCSITSYVGISDNTGPTGGTSSIFSPSCNGLNDGSISVSGVGGTAPYVYYWPHNGSVNSSISNITAGNYFVEITDQQGCTKVEEIVVAEPSSIFVSPMIMPSNCGASDGSIDLTVSGGAGSYSYNWSTTQNTSSISNLSSGIYSVDITDAIGCSINENYTVSEFNALAIDLALTNVSCFGGSNGEINTTVLGATGSINYNWYDLSGALISTGNADLNALNSGTYFVEIEDVSLGCSQFNSATLTQPSEAIISLPNLLSASCDASCDGGATVVIAGDNSPYVYNWSNGATGNGVNGLCSGPNVVTITDANNCVLEETVIIDVNETIDVQYFSVDATCGSCDGQATLSPSGGSGNFTITWYDGISGTSHQDLCAGIYGYVINDNNGCSFSGEVSINNTGGPDNEVVSINNVSCYGGNDASVSVIPSGGTPPYNYLWVPGGQTTNVVSGLSAGNYYLEVEDANGCIRVVDVTINEPDPIQIQSVIEDAGCNGNNGSISVVATGGNSPFAINWSGPNLFTSSGENISNLAGGNYLGIITDALGCVDSAFFSLNEINADIISFTVSKPSCYNSCDGSISADPVGTNYAYTWSNTETTSSISNLCPGLYGLDLVNTLTGCRSSAYVNLDEPDSISLSIAFATVSSCNNACDAQASVIPSGGSGPFIFSWSPSLDITPSVQNLCAGINVVTVTDANGCTNSQEITIEQPDSISITVDFLQDAYCVNNADGEINISVFGGDGNYTYSWTTSPSSSFSSNLEDITNLLPTTYIISILDGNNCSFDSTILVDTSNVLIADAGLDTSLCLNDCITITGTASGTSNFTLVWLDTLGNIVSNADTLEICSPNELNYEYILQATDQNCVSTDSILIITNSLPIVEAGVDISEIYGETVQLGGAPTAPSGAVVSWSPSINFYSIDDTSLYNPEIELISTQQYTVTVIDTNGCISSDSIVVIPIPEIYHGTGFSPNGDGVNDVWEIDRIDDYPNCIVEIYNRWGEQLFRSVGYTQKWDGQYKNKPLPVGTYYYIIELNDPKFPDPYTGPVTIMR